MICEVSGELCKSQLWSLIRYLALLNFVHTYHFPLLRAQWSSCKLLLVILALGSYLENHSNSLHPLKADCDCPTSVSSEAWAKLRDWASLAGRGRLLLSGSVAHASLKTAVLHNLLDTFPVR